MVGETWCVSIAPLRSTPPTTPPVPFRCACLAPCCAPPLPRSCVPSAPVMLPLLHALPQTARLVLEVFQGAGHLSISLGTAGLGVELGIDADGAKGRCRESQDLNKPCFQQHLYDLICQGVFAYIHFALPCSTWTVLKCFSKGTRTSAKPGGGGSVAAGADANRLATLVIRCCFAQARNNMLSSIENPSSSFSWKYINQHPGVGELKHSNVQFDQCANGLTCKHQGSHHPVTKPTQLLTNAHSLKRLRLKCPGNHSHLTAFGSVAKASAAYPQPLCDSWAENLLLELY